MVGDRRWSPFVFICFALLLQTLHDLFVNFVVLSNIPGGKNDMMDIAKKYAQENGSRAFVGHSVFLVFVCIMAMFLKETTTLFTFIVVLIAVWLLPLMLSSVGPKPPPPPPAEKKKTVEDNWNGSRFSM
jgi:isoprenylcysteine carboxyl methyltransferase (ICMT) family protein YpbQ